MDELIKIGLIAVAVCVSITLAVVPIFADENTFISIYSSGCENCPNIYELIEYDNGLFSASHMNGNSNIWNMGADTRTPEFNNIHSMMALGDRLPPSIHAHRHHRCCH